MKRGLMKRKVYKLFFYVRSFDCFLGVISIFENSEFFRFLVKEINITSMCYRVIFKILD